MDKEQSVEKEYELRFWLHMDFAYGSELHFYHFDSINECMSCFLEHFKKIQMFMHEYGLINLNITAFISKGGETIIEINK